MEYSDYQSINGEYGQAGDQTSVRDDSAERQATGIALTPVVALVSVEEFRRLRIAPVSFDPAGRRLKLVCAASVDENQRRDFAGRMNGMDCEWYHADEEVLDAMLQRLAGEYAPIDSISTDTLDDILIGAESTSAPATEEPVAAAQSTPAIAETAPEKSRDAIVPPGQKYVLFISPTGKISQHLLFAFNAERCRPITVNNPDQALAELEKQSMACVFIHEKFHGRSDQLIQRLQTTSPATPVRHYSSEAGLLLNDTRNQAVFDLVRQNLTLFSRLHSAQGSALSGHAAAVARYADRMAVRLGVPDHCRLMISTAAFLHNMAEETLTSTEGLQPTDIIGLAASRLESWDFPAPVVRMLRRMYRRIGEPGVATEGIEATSGYILTAADAFCHLWPECASAGRQMDLVQKKLEDQLQWKVMPSVIGTLVDVICDDCTARMLRPTTFHVHLFESRGSLPAGLVEALASSEFNVAVSSSIGECAQGCRQSKADLLIIRDSGSVQDIYDTLMSLALRGIAVDQLHAVLLLEESIVADAHRLLPHGVEEILPWNAQLPAITTKLVRIKNRLDEQYRHRVSAIERLGTHGSLSDMSLTDILELWRGNRRPARISVTAFGNQLTVYLDRGKVVAAESGECEGLNALLRGVSWRQGIWNIDSIETSELPEPNIDQSIDAVLIEACSKLDEVVKEEPMYALPSSSR